VNGNKAKAILIAGYYGFGNAGDEAILSVILTDLRERRDDLKFIVVSGNPSETAAAYDVSSVHWQDIDALLDAAKESDLIILGGGGLFQDHWGVPKGTSLTPFHSGISFYSAIGMLAVLYQKPFMIYSVGVGPVTSEEGKRLTRWTFDLADICSVREQESRDILISLGIPEEKVEVLPDPALTLSFDSPTTVDILASRGIDPTTTPLLGVCVRNWRNEETAKRWKKELAATLDQFLEAHNAHIIFIPFQILDRALENDHLAALDLFSLMQNRDRVSLIPESYPPVVIRGLISHCHLIIGMRLHSLIFAANTGVPAVALVYDPKVGNFMRSLGLSDYAVDLPSLTIERLFSVMEAAWLQQTPLRQTLEIQMQKLRNLAKKTPDMALRLLDEGSKLPFSMEFVQELAIQQTRALAGKEQELQTLVSQTAAKEHEVQMLKSQLDEIMRSKSWKLAEAFRQTRISLVPVGSFRERVVRVVYRYARKAFHTIERGVTLIHQSIRRPGLDGKSTLAEIRLFTAELQSILDGYPDTPGVVIFLPTIGWNISLFQRPHQMARALAKKGFLVFFYTEYQADDVKSFKKVSRGLYLANPPWPVFDLVEQPIVFTLPYNREYLFQLRQPLIVYEVIDDLDVFPGDKILLQKNHDALLKEADVVVVTADKLMEQVKRVRTDAIMCPNAVDWDHFSQARETGSASLPPDLASIMKPNRPVIGYYGALARWFDYDLVRQAAQRHPDWDFVLIGPNHDNTLIASNILSMQNIHWLGARDYSNLPDYLRYFTVATIPFLINNITLATSPIKLFEYMAAGKPIVTSDLPECRKYPGVFVALDSKEYVDYLEYALTLVDDSVYLQQLEQTALENTWEARVNQIIDALESFQNSKSPFSKLRR
jgi:polysaccharide pyruvyl transferase CsaB